MLEADHFALEVSDMDRAIGFYTHILGLELISRSVSEEERTEYAFLTLAGGNLELVRLLDKDTGSLQGAKKPPYCPHIALRSDSMDQTISMLKEKQVHIIEGPFAIKGIVKWVYFSDPDNNVLEFVQWL
jgi:catechol 2,3-dioxygenase-like lactoylglutathione lyase family enzyme